MSYRTMTVDRWGHHCEETDYLNRHKCFFDPALGIFFYSGIVCCNLVPITEIPHRIETAMESVVRYGVDTLDFGSHEQYTFPDYPNYVPDHLDRIMLTARLLKENGFQPVFFNDGLLGNMSWE